MKVEITLAVSTDLVDTKTERKAVRKIISYLTTQFGSCMATEGTGFREDSEGNIVQDKVAKIESTTSFFSGEQYKDIVVLIRGYLESCKQECVLFTFADMPYFVHKNKVEKVDEICEI